MKMNIDNQRICFVGDIKISQPTNEEYYEMILIELEQFMIKHRIDKIDIGWGRFYFNIN